jgi:hypothetical protein
MVPGPFRLQQNHAATAGTPHLAPGQPSIAMETLPAMRAGKAEIIHQRGAESLAPHPFLKTFRRKVAR